MVLFIGVETRGYRLTAYSRSGESAILFDQYYPLDIDMGSMFDKENEIAYKLCEDIAFIEKKLGVKFKCFYMICQNNHLVVRKIEVLKDSKRKDIDLVVDIEIMELLNLNKDRYSLIYKRGQVDENDMVYLEVCLFPNYLYSIVRAIEKNAKLHITNPKYFHSYSFHIDNGYQYFSYRERQEYALSLLGDYQLDNAMVICDAIDCLKKRGISIPEDCVKQGLMTVTWPGRFEILKKRPLIILDGAHNPQAVNSLVRSIEMLFPNYKKRIFFSVMADKDYMTMLELLKTNTLSFSFFQVETHRGQSPEILKKEWQEHFSGEIYCPNTLEEGLEWNLNAVKKEEEKTLLLCLGSLYQVGQIRNFFRNYYSSH